MFTGVLTHVHVAVGPNLLEVRSTVLRVFDTVRPTCSFVLKAKMGCSLIGTPRF